MSDLTKLAMSVVKVRAKSLGLTQEQLAKKLGVSLPTMKRWLGGGTLTLEILKRLCDEVGLSLSEVFVSMEEQSRTRFSYTNDQERYFSEHPDCLAFFDHLLRGSVVAGIQRKFSLSDHRTHQYLKKLEELELIEWLPKNKVKLRVSGEPVWKKGGALSTKLRKEIFESFLANEDKAKSHFYLHDYLPEDILQIQTKVNELLQLASQANSRAKFKSSEAKPSALYLSLQDFRWNLDHYLKSEGKSR